MAASPGQKLRLVRESLRLTLRDVETATAEIALHHGQPKFTVPYVRLFRIETKGLEPTIYSLYSLAVTYRKDCCEILSWYGVDFDTLYPDLALDGVSVTHRVESRVDAGMIHRHLRAKISEPATGTALMLAKNSEDQSSRFCKDTASRRFSYVCVGTEDYTMYPLIPPGSFLQIDESRLCIARTGWRSEYERPVYLVETRGDGLRVGWCSVAGGVLTIQPHPLSATSIRSYRCPRDAEVVGQVIAVSMRLVEPENARSTAPNVGSGRTASYSAPAILAATKSAGG